ncbi:MAG: oligosaccharide flippase family protein [Verrucomicrobiaceae bacterium]|nr:oligosaccharide flippase family protein [Verrucomicrobiaceae bacterium]
MLACSGFSYWALVLPMSIAGFISLLLSLHAARWLPSRNISTFAEAKGIIVYGGTLALSTIANRVIQGIDLMLLGRYIPLGELGYYSRAKSLMTGTLQQALGPIAAVMIPVLSRLRNDPDKFNNWVRKISVLITLVAAPSSALISVNSSVIVQLLLGNSWSEAAPFFTVIALGIFLMSHGAYYYWILVATGNPATLVKSTWIGATITLVAVFVGLPWGGIGVALATMLSGIFLRAPVLIHLINQTGKVEKGLLTRAYVRSVVEVVVWYLILYSMSVGCSQIFDFSEVMAAILLALIALGFLAARVWLSKEGRELVLSLRGNIRENFSLRKR